MAPIRAITDSGNSQLGQDNYTPIWASTHTPIWATSSIHQFRHYIFKPIWATIKSSASGEFGHYTSIAIWAFYLYSNLGISLFTAIRAFHFSPQFGGIFQFSHFLYKIKATNRKILLLITTMGLRTQHLLAPKPSPFLM